jgi:hypothetical protein
MSNVFEFTSSGPVRVVSRPFVYEVKNISQHEITVEATSGGVLEVTPRTQKIKPGHSAGFDFNPISDVGGNASVEFSSGSQHATVHVEVARNVPPAPGHCFTGATFVLLADGSARAIRELAIGDELRTVDELGHLTAKPIAVGATITAVMRHDSGDDMLDVCGIAVTAEHPWAVRDEVEPRFITTDALDPTRHQMLAIDRLGKPTWLATSIARASGRAETTWNLETTARTFAVASSANGPFFVVHNSKPDDPRGEGLYDPPLDGRLKP